MTHTKLQLYAHYMSKVRIDCVVYCCLLQSLFDFYSNFCSYSNLLPSTTTDVQLLEEPCGNYVTWDIREGRWNRGELVLAHYFFPRSLGAFFTWAMCKARKKPPPKHTLRTPTEFDKLGAYIAHSALRHMILKPLLLLYIIIRSFVTPFQYYPWMPIYVMIALVLVIPKIPILRWNNLHLILAETLASIIQFSPEPVMGTIRIIKACRAHITGISGWTPQFKVEQVSPQDVTRSSCILICAQSFLCHRHRWDRCT